MEWQPIETAPFGVVVWVKNSVMNEPVLATRGYAPGGVLHPDGSFFTTAYTPHKFFPTPAGLLVCPTHWLPQESAKDTPPPDNGTPDNE